MAIARDRGLESTARGGSSPGRARVRPHAANGNEYDAAVNRGQVFQLSSKALELAGTENCDAMGTKVRHNGRNGSEKESIKNQRLAGVLH